MVRRWYHKGYKLHGYAFLSSFRHSFGGRIWGTFTFISHSSFRFIIELCSVLCCLEFHNHIPHCSFSDVLMGATCRIKYEAPKSGTDCA